MSRFITNQENREVIAGIYDTIEAAMKTAHSHIKGGASSRPEIVDLMFKFIESQAERAQEFKWPDPALRLAQAAHQDAALQKLIKRASKSTFIRTTAAKARFERSKAVCHD
jgi:hypothetical protein